MINLPVSTSFLVLISKDNIFLSRSSLFGIFTDTPSNSSIFLFSKTSSSGTGGWGSLVFTEATLAVIRSDKAIQTQRARGTCGAFILPVTLCLFVSSSPSNQDSSNQSECNALVDSTHNDSSFTVLYFKCTPIY